MNTIFDFLGAVAHGIFEVTRNTLFSVARNLWLLAKSCIALLFFFFLLDTGWEMTYAPSAWSTLGYTLWSIGLLAIVAIVCGLFSLARGRTRLIDIMQERVGVGLFVVLDAVCIACICIWSAKNPDYKFRSVFLQKTKDTVMTVISNVPVLPPTKRVPSVDSLSKPSSPTSCTVPDDKKYWYVRGNFVSQCTMVHAKGLVKTMDGYFTARGLMRNSGCTEITVILEADSGNEMVFDGDPCDGGTGALFLESGGACIRWEDGEWRRLPVDEKGGVKLQGNTKFSLTRSKAWFGKVSLTCG